MRRTDLVLLSKTRKSWGVLNNPMGWVQLVIANSLIASMLAVVNDTSFMINMAFSQITGFFVVMAITLNVGLRTLPRPDWKTYVTSIPIGAFLGIVISAELTGEYQSFNASQFNKVLLNSVLFSVILGAAVAWYFHLRGKHLLERTLLAEQFALNAEREKQLSEARLVALQAQIEPHFLFNTLSNVISLIDNDQASARKMLEALTDFLRSSLMTTRGDFNTVQQEMILLESYLAILKIRMGDRLNYHFLVDEQCKVLNLAPLLLQPLIENAVKHGLEPEIEGGQINIIVKKDREYLVCEVEDSGRGFQPEDDVFQTEPCRGIGLENVRKRLSSLYGEKARLKIKDNHQGGVTASIMIPLDAINTKANRSDRDDDSLNCG